MERRVLETVWRYMGLGGDKESRMGTKKVDTNYLKKMENLVECFFLISSMRFKGKLMQI